MSEQGSQKYPDQSICPTESMEKGSSRVPFVDIENAALSLDTQTFRVFSRLPKNIETSVKNMNTFRLHEVNADSTDDNLSASKFNMGEGTSLAPDETLQPEENSSKEILPEEEFDKLKPGTRLRHAREQRGLSVQQVADKLYLSTHLLKALENDDHGSLPSAVFVRGYLRNYAKLVDLPPSAIVEAYDLIGRKHPPALTTPQMSQKSQISINDPRFRAITAIIIVALMVLMTLWSIYPDTPSPRQPEATDSTEELLVPSQSEKTESIPLSVPPATNAQGGNEQNSTLTNTPPVKSPSEEGKQITLKFKKKSWLQVTDSENKVLYKNTGKEGDNSTLTGKPPFKVRAGDAAAITVDYLGETIELHNHAKKEGRYYLFNVEETPSQPTATPGGVLEQKSKNNNQLTVRFKQKTWLQISDKNDKVLHKGYGDKEKPLTVTGEPPFKVKIGQVKDVDVEYTGETVNLTNYSKKQGKSFIFGE